jgi:hypothetical protein
MHVAPILSFQICTLSLTHTSDNKHPSRISILFRGLLPSFVQGVKLQSLCRWSDLWFSRYSHPLIIVAIVAIMESRCSSLRRCLLCTDRCHELLKLLLFLHQQPVKVHVIAWIYCLSAHYFYCMIPTWISACNYRILYGNCSCKLFILQHMFLLCVHFSTSRPHLLDESSIFVCPNCTKYVHLRQLKHLTHWTVFARAKLGPKQQSVIMSEEHPVRSILVAWIGDALGLNSRFSLSKLIPTLADFCCCSGAKFTCL